MAISISGNSALQFWGILVCNFEESYFELNTAIDDCTKLRVLQINPNKSTQYTVSFLGAMLDDFWFPIRVVQTDRGTEFFIDASKKNSWNTT